ncbi:hypothetical protein PIB30_102533, partial [Stylosanthes scabra]|nr:hypothetical protein [Stylosanthes scabra]
APVNDGLMKKESQLAVEEEKVDAAMLAHLVVLVEGVLTAGLTLVRKSGVSLQISPDQCQGNSAKFSLKRVSQRCNQV